MTRWEGIATGKRLKKNGTTTKRIVWVCLINGIIWVYGSYLLAYLGREQIAEGLSQVALKEIIAVVFVYALKALIEKRKDFGAVGQNENKS